MRWYNTGTASESYTEICWQAATAGTTTYTNYIPFTYYTDAYQDNGTAIQNTTSPGEIPYWQPYTTYPNRITNEIRQQQSQLSPPKPLSPEEERAREEARVKAREVAEKAEKERKIAEEKAKVLLLEHLDDVNKQKYNDKKPLEITSRLFSDIIYQIPISRIGRIRALKENQVISELCLLVNGGQGLPTDDVVLTKLLYTKHDEENMLRTANHSSVKESLLARLN